MASELQIEANRLNSQKSTGPITPEGKAAVRLNSLRHGLYAAAIVLPGEDQDQFDQLCLDLQDEWKPQTHTQRHHVDELAAAEWHQARLARSLPKLMERDPDPLARFLLQDKVDKYLARLQRSHSRALKELRTLQKARAHDATKPRASTDATEPRASATGIPDPTEPRASATGIPFTEEFLADRLKFQPGMAWLDGKGHAKIACPAEVRDVDGKWHYLPLSQSPVPEEWNLVAPPELDAWSREQIEKNPFVPVTADGAKTDA